MNDEKKLPLGMIENILSIFHDSKFECQTCWKWVKGHPVPFNFKATCLDCFNKFEDQDDTVMPLPKPSV